MSETMFEIIGDGGPVVATAIHCGHDLRPEVEALCALSEEERLREEDPHTDRFTEAAPRRLLLRRSRFEVDLNRPRDKAVYINPEDAWGLRVWRETPPEELVGRSLAEYDAFYGQARALLEQVSDAHEAFLVLDLHSYNHRRDGATSSAAPTEENPEVNVGTGSLDRPRWGQVADAFMEGLREYPFMGRQLDVRENVKFRGGNFPGWVNRTFAGRGCALAIEFKKLFMDEWTGEMFPDVVAELTKALTHALQGVGTALEAVGRTR